MLHPQEVPSPRRLRWSSKLVAAIVGSREKVEEEKRKVFIVYTRATIAAGSPVAIVKTCAVSVCYLEALICHGKCLIVNTLQPIQWSQAGFYSPPSIPRLPTASCTHTCYRIDGRDTNTLAWKLFFSAINTFLLFALHSLMANVAFKSYYNF